MQIQATELTGVYIITPKIFGDDRGWFFESWSKTKLTACGIECDFVQDNHSMSKQSNTLRGLHFQLNPKAQAKLLRCTKGEILDVAVDIRKNSPTYRKWVSVKLSEDNKKQLFIPKGFAHGFLTLTDDVQVMYKADEYYSPEHDRSIAWNDPTIGVAWGCKNPILSQKDKNAPLLSESDVNFI